LIKVLITCLVGLKLVYCVLEIACKLVWFYMATSKPLNIAQTGSNFENCNFFVVFSAYRVQKSTMLNLSHTTGHPIWILSQKFEFEFFSFSALKNISKIHTCILVIWNKSHIRKKNHVDTKHVFFKNWYFDIKIFFGEMS
jgi:hypothetical protein